MPLLNYAVHGTVPPVFIFRFEIREILILFSPESAVWKNELCYLFYQVPPFLKILFCYLICLVYLKKYEMSIKIRKNFN